MSNPTYIAYSLGFISTLVIVILTFIIIIKSEKIRQLQLTTEHLKNSLDQMDEQAKLIVRTDLELNKIQEELDKKVSGLYTLQKLSRTFASTLDEKEIFNQIKSEHIEELGMQRALGFIWQEKEKRFLECLSIGYSRQELNSIIQEIDSNKNTYLKLIGQEKPFSLRSSDMRIISAQEIKRVFKIRAFCISPILPKEGTQGFLFVGTTSEEVPITEGDEELITILAHSIGQALENARLFEATWRAQQELEKRVEQRTQELTEVVEELKELSKRKSNFVSAVSHELRTPLTSIKGYASILLSKKMGAISDPIQERLEKINRHSDELVHMVNDLLDISRIESGRVVMKKQLYNLKELAEEVLDLLSVQIKNKSLSLSVDVPSDINVFVDKSQIERVFVNLIGNAIKFTPEKKKITLNTKPAGDFIQVNVSDTGIGIPKEAQKTIFEEFYRVDNPINEKVKGTGLGLSLVKNIIEAHQGSIWVESQPGSGSTFSFLLPTKDIEQNSTLSEQKKKG
jgi:signal transduction histidine kinase